MEVGTLVRQGQLGVQLEWVSRTSSGQLPSSEQEVEEHTIITTVKYVLSSHASRNSYSLTLPTSTQYGDARNSSRPGGPQVTAVFQSATLPDTYRLLSDTVTVTSLISSITDSCNTLLSTTSITPAEYRGDDLDLPKPEQVIQYYRASSVALSLDGYNNTGALSDDPNAPNTPLPSTIDTSLLSCLNTTIGRTVPLVDSGAFGLQPQSGIGLLGVVGAVWVALSMF